MRKFKQCFVQICSTKFKTFLIYFFSSVNFSSWNAGVGPTKDAYTIGDNPQFNLRVGAGQGSVWVLLTRHITSIEDFRENHEYITLLVYQNGGKRIYYPCEFEQSTSEKHPNIFFYEQFFFSIFRRSTAIY